MSLLRPPIIDFTRSKPRRLGGLLLSAVGVVAVALAAMHVKDSQALLSAQREGLRTVQAQSPAARALAALSPEERRRRQQMEVVANYLAAPWEGLLSAFESRAKGKVVVRKLEPDAATGMVRMVGETQSLKSMMDYVQGLETDKRLHEVVLLKHERSQENNAPAAPAIPGAGGESGGGAGANAPIEFTVVAGWRVEARQAPATASGGDAGAGNAPGRTATTAGVGP
ncbi:MAG: hypothetical protein RLZZ584_4088 [Pseudomonadota bacterium]